MASTRQFILCLFALVGCLLTACQGGKEMKYYNFPDAVTSINQVDPAYRKHFVDQQGRNYSADDQRKGVPAAIRTSRTPVPAYVPRSSMASSRKVQRRSSTRSGRSAVARKKVVTKRKVVAKRKLVAKRKVVVKRKVVTKRKAVPRKRAVAKNRSRR